MEERVLLISPTDIKQRTGLHDSVDEKLVFPEIGVAQDMHLRTALGTALYDRVLTEVVAGEVSAAVAALRPYITDALVWATMQSLPIMTTYQFYNKGVMRKVGDNVVGPSKAELDDISNIMRGRGELYRQRLIDYVRAQAALSPNPFPEWLAPGVSADTVHPDGGTSYTCSIYLGEGPDSCYDYERR